MKKTDQIAKEISEIIPTFMRHMFPYVFQSISVPPSQVLALVAIEEKGSLTLSELRKEMHVSAPTISGVVSRLEKAGYIQRVADPSDRRVSHVQLTSRGKKVIQEFRNNIRKRWGYILAKLPSDVQDLPLKFLNKITQGLSDGTI